MIYLLGACIVLVRLRRCLGRVSPAGGLMLSPAAAVAAPVRAVAAAPTGTLIVATGRRRPRGATGAAGWRTSSSGLVKLRDTCLRRRAGSGAGAFGCSSTGGGAPPSGFLFSAAVVVTLPGTSSPSVEESPRPRLRPDFTSGMDMERRATAGIGIASSAVSPSTSDVSREPNCEKVGVGIGEPGRNPCSGWLPNCCPWLWWSSCADNDTARALLWLLPPPPRSVVGPEASSNGSGSLPTSEEDTHRTTEFCCC
jgi:hypothetical protein